MDNLIRTCSTALRMAAMAAIAAATLTIPAAVSAQAPERTGKQIVDTLCASCHATGAGGAPKIGDTKAWAARASKGLTGLTTSALAGINQMPAHGGSLKLTDTEVTSKDDDTGKEETLVRVKDKKDK